MKKKLENWLGGTVPYPAKPKSLSDTSVPPLPVVSLHHLRHLPEKPFPVVSPTSGNSPPTGRKQPPSGPTAEPLFIILNAPFDKPQSAAAPNDPGIPPLLLAPLEDPADNAPPPKDEFAPEYEAEEETVEETVTENAVKAVEPEEAPEEDAAPHEIFQEEIQEKEDINVDVDFEENADTDAEGDEETEEVGESVIYVDSATFQDYAYSRSNPEKRAARFDEQLRRIAQMRRLKRAGAPRTGFRENFKRFFVTALIFILVAGTIFALWRSMRRNSFDALMTKANQLYHQEQFASAYETYGKAASAYPSRLEPLAGMARSAEQTGRIADAIRAWDGVLILFPADANAERARTLCETGRLYTILSAWDEARISFENAARLDGTNFNAFFSLGRVLEEQKNFERALAAYRRALSLSPSSDAAANAVERLDEALSFAQKSEQDAAQRERKYGQALRGGQAALELRRYDEASKLFSEALSIRSDDAASWAGFAAARQGLGDTAGAIRYFRGALEIDPKNSDIKEKLKTLEEATKKNTPAKNARPQKKSATPDAASPLLSQRALFEDGVTFYMAGEYAEAFDAFMACLRSPGRETLPSAPLAGEVGPLWRGVRIFLPVPRDMALLSEALRLNPRDRDLYLNLSLAGTKMNIDRNTLRSAINTISSHARNGKNNYARGF